MITTPINRHNLHHSRLPKAKRGNLAKPQVHLTRARFQGGVERTVPPVKIPEGKVLPGVLSGKTCNALLKAAAKQIDSEHQTTLAHMKENPSFWTPTRQEKYDKFHLDRPFHASVTLSQDTHGRWHWPADQNTEQDPIFLEAVREAFGHAQPELTKLGVFTRNHSECTIECRLLRYSAKPGATYDDTSMGWHSDYSPWTLLVYPASPGSSPLGAWKGGELLVRRIPESEKTAPTKLFNWLGLNATARNPSQEDVEPRRVPIEAGLGIVLNNKRTQHRVAPLTPLSPSPESAEGYCERYVLGIFITPTPPNKLKALFQKAQRLFGK